MDWPWTQLDKAPEKAKGAIGAEAAVRGHFLRRKRMTACAMRRKT